MKGAGFHARIQPGDGVVARFGEVAAVVAPAPDASIDALLELLGSAYDDPRDLAWELASLVAAQRRDAPRFAVMLGAPDERRVILHGGGRALIGDTTITSDTTWTWLERPVPAGLDAIALAVVDGPLTAVPRSNLRDGVLAGTALLLTFSPEITAPLHGARQAFDAPTPPPPLDPPPPDPAPPTPPSSNLPDAPPVPIPAVPRPGVPPPLQTVMLTDSIASLAADDGSRIALDRSYVLGRDPRNDPAVASGIASPVKIPDPEQTVSRVHAYVDVNGSMVTVRDAGSANGTFVAAPGATEWTRIDRTPVVLGIGDSVRIGVRVYTHVAGAPT